MTFDISPRSDLVQRGWTEDGDADVAECFYLVARAKNGAQWAHRFSLDAYRGNHDAVTARMDRLRARVIAHLAAGGALDMDHWTEVDPAYGSAAYQGLDAQGYFRAQERQAARDAGEAVPYDEPGDAFFA